MAETATTTTAQTTGAPASEPQQTAQAANAPAAEQQSASENKGGSLDELIQKAVDRATNKLGNENKKLRGEIETLKKASMDADELKNFELSEKEKEIAEREKALTDRENRLIAIKAIKEAGLDDGSDASLAIIDFVMAEDENGIKERVKAFDALVKRIVKAQVDGVFKSNGRIPGMGTDGAANTVGKDESIAARMGKNAAAINQKSRSILDSYLGGK